jgi:hypothetical protein
MTYAREMKKSLQKWYSNLHMSFFCSNFAGKIETDETNRHAKDTEKDIP